MPSKVESLDMQKKRALVQLRAKSSDMEKYMFLAHLRNTNVSLFYKIVCDELSEIAPIIYTPTVGKACMEYSHIYPFLAPPGVPDGLYITKDSLPNLPQYLRDYGAALSDKAAFQPEITVISDGSRILGLGDLGMNGMGIPIGKLQLYVAGAGIDPRKTLPILLDLGTNNDTLLNDEFYLGVKQKRPNDDEFYSAVDQTINALYETFPNILVQFEDWSTSHAFTLLNKYQNEKLCFNDDIQGTGAVVLAGLINAFRQVVKDTPIENQRILFSGAGSAAFGVAKHICEYLIREHGIPEEKAKAMFWTVDSKGLVYDSRGDNLPEHKQYFSRKDSVGGGTKSLLEIVKAIKPTTSQADSFNASVLQEMANINRRPIVFPLSNPRSRAECTFEAAMKHTNNQVLFASGTAFPAYKIPETGEVKIPAQGNNVYVFPGIGLGSIVSKSKHISTGMIIAAAKGLANSLNDKERARGDLYPSLDRIRDVSATVAAHVCMFAEQNNLLQNPSLAGLSVDQLTKAMREKMWDPETVFKTIDSIEDSE
ncbi:malic enzyme [Umbelopsis sp. PMI_123]|nr:malic enzyme [Umbelopsis sp. PMI_123]